MVEVEKVEKLDNGKFVINGSVMVSDVEMMTNGDFSAKVDHDGKYSEDEIEVLLGQFIGDAIADLIEQSE